MQEYFKCPFVRQDELFEVNDDMNECPYMCDESSIDSSNEFNEPIPVMYQAEAFNRDDKDPKLFLNGAQNNQRPGPMDPPPILSDNPADISVMLFKELTAYPNYGNPSGNADILYTGNRGVWTFQLPAVIPSNVNLSGTLYLRGVLDDHSNVPTNLYSATITVNGFRVHTGIVPLKHGTPPNSQFTNWRTLTFKIPVIRRNNRVVIENTSRTRPNDWIAFDWMQLELRTSIR